MKLMATLALFLLWVHGAQAALSDYIPIPSLFGKTKPGSFLLKATSFKPSHFTFLVDISDPPSHLRKTWEYTGGISGALAFHCEQDFEFTGYLSIPQAMTLGKKDLIALGIPQEATQFAFSYPVGELKGALAEDTEGKNFDADVAFFSIGGYMYFDAEKNLLSAMALSKNDEKGWLKFHQSLPWQPKWSKAMPPGLFHHVTIPALVKEGKKFFMWIPPAEMFLSGDEKAAIEQRKKASIWFKLRTFFQKSPTKEQPKCPHGCFAYLGHHPKKKAPTKEEQKHDVYFPLEFNEKQLKLLEL